MIIPGKPMPDHAWSFANGFGQDSGGVERCFRIWSPKMFQDWTWFRKNKESFGQYTTSKLSYWLAPAGHPWADQGCEGRTQGTRDCVWAVENEEIQEVKRGMTPVNFEMWFSVIAQFLMWVGAAENDTIFYRYHKHQLFPTLFGSQQFPGHGLSAACACGWYSTACMWVYLTYGGWPRTPKNWGPGSRWFYMCA